MTINVCQCCHFLCDPTNVCACPTYSSASCIMQSVRDLCCHVTILTVVGLQLGCGRQTMTDCECDKTCFVGWIDCSILFCCK